jgi:hypothetical protein
MAADTTNRVPSGLLINEWADVPLPRIVVWQTIVGLFWSLVWGWPGRPRTIVGGALLVAFAVIVAVPLAWATRRFGNPVFHNPVARRLALRTDDQASSYRIVYLLAAFCVAGAVVLGLGAAAKGAASIVAHERPDIPAFLERHLR